jgi:hypothetical protein
MTDYLAMLRQRLHPQKGGSVSFIRPRGRPFCRAEVGSVSFVTDPGICFCWGEGVAQLNSTRPPENIPPRRWVQFINDCNQFLKIWATQANALGWEALDLFGCDSVKPYSRVDRQGLVWILNGRRVIAMTAEAATIEGAGSSRLAYRRERKNDRILAWKLQCF